MHFCFKNRQLELDNGPRLMGVVNVTPDSFSDGGDYYSAVLAAAHCVKLLKDGADVIDIGGESTRPGSPAISVHDEIARVVPVIAEFRKQAPEAVVSIDTRKAEVAAAALDAGADIINDVSGLEYSVGMTELAAATGAGLIIMHMRGTPENMQQPRNLAYRNLIEEISVFLARAAQKALDYGVKRENIILDPGLGFAKTVEQNFQLLRKLGHLRTIGYPLLVGPSRKSFIGAVTGRENPRERTAGTIGVAAFLTLTGTADIIRVHDVREVRDALTAFRLCLKDDDGGVSRKYVSGNLREFGRE